MIGNIGERSDFIRVIRTRSLFVVYSLNEVLLLINLLGYRHHNLSILVLIILNSYYSSVSLGTGECFKNGWYIIPLAISLALIDFTTVVDETLALLSMPVNGKVRQSLITQVSRGFQIYAPNFRFFFHNRFEAYCIVVKFSCMINMRFQLEFVFTIFMSRR